MAPIDMITTPIMRVFFLPIFSPGTYPIILEAESYENALKFTKYKGGHSTEETRRSSKQEDRNTGQGVKEHTIQYRTKIR